MRRTTLIKIAAALVALGVFGVLFIRSARSVGAEPYTMSRAGLSGWTAGVDPAAATSGVLLALWPPQTLAPPLFSQLFTRSGVSLSGPNPVGMPLVLKAEFDRGLSGTITPDALVELARASGLESRQARPLCMASRRVSEPGVTREVFFLRLQHPAFGEFRRQLATRASAEGAGGSSFNPKSVSPVVIVAATDGNFSSWLPLSGDDTQDCLAPIEVK